jgi:hypothetical protein
MVLIGNNSADPRVGVTITPAAVAGLRKKKLAANSMFIISSDFVNALTIMQRTA